MNLRFEQALFFSDVHLGWVPLVESHERWLDHLPAAAGDADLVVLNGDIIDDHRGQPSARVRELIARFTELVDRFRREGRNVVYVEGNHDLMHQAKGPLVPTVWRLDLTSREGRRVHVLHGHRFAEEPEQTGPYERYGKRFLRLENWCYSKMSALRAIYPHSIGWLAGAVGLTEDLIWRPGLYRQAGGFADVDVLVHGHYHFGPGRVQVGKLELIRTGAWVSRGHRGTVDRMLRYRNGRFERITLEGGRWIVPGDGR